DVEQRHRDRAQPGRPDDPAADEPARVDLPPETAAHRRFGADDLRLDVLLEVADHGGGPVDQGRLAEAADALVGVDADHDEVAVAVVQDVRGEVDDAHAAR